MHTQADAELILLIFMSFWYVRFNKKFADMKKDIQVCDPIYEIYENKEK